jgi:hypothetical protein
MRPSHATETVSLSLALRKVPPNLNHSAANIYVPLGYAGSKGSRLMVNGRSDTSGLVPLMLSVAPLLLVGVIDNARNV